MKPKGIAAFKTPSRYQVREHWGDAGRRCAVLSLVHVGQEWAVVLWDDSEDPDVFKFRGLTAEIAAPEHNHGPDTCPACAATKHESTL